MILSSVEPRTVARASSEALPEWHEDHQEGQLSVDVFHSDRDIVVVSPMAGAIKDKIEVYVHNDLLTIRGMRRFPLATKIGYAALHEECYWGTFSRTIVLPLDVKGDQARAEYENGVLTIHIPKRRGETGVPIRIVDR